MIPTLDLLILLVLVEFPAVAVWIHLKMFPVASRFD